MNANCMLNNVFTRKAQRLCHDQYKQTQVNEKDAMMCSQAPYPLLLLLELPDGILSLLQFSNGLITLLFDGGQLPFYEVVFLSLLGPCHLSLWT